MYKVALNTNEMNLIAKLFYGYNNYSNKDYKRMLIDRLEESTYLEKEDNISKLKKEVLRLLKLFNVTEGRMLSICIDRYSQEEITVIISEMISYLSDTNYIEDIIKEINTIWLRSDILKVILGKQVWYEAIGIKEEGLEFKEIEENYILDNLNSIKCISSKLFIEQLKEKLSKYNNLDTRCFRSRMYLYDILHVIVDIEKALLMVYLRSDEFNY